MAIRLPPDKFDSLLFEGSISAASACYFLGFGYFETLELVTDARYRARLKESIRVARILGFDKSNLIERDEQK